ncbi:MAG: hypothetical protein A2268_09245 [Candidatus Raymondbacteria bacterium RifOxyA12_full_50_37]|uniref:SpoVT-AbrB domain-containing protein n=1 Tax=Candidatus Raymondbacteria bacterium RIFOXYD12_FULL_49_13 TaxID=1817890 RepID=A0A1F7FG33_UNCRA|nr:MAG: hypothetical protein A2268_09245 [Candidatus Raymondbacteria bacterium RifOxyA12_full_50_37]OGJ91550.1 MAG: hypothetical protein A2248_09795 [Candidatus Raymondbacteria bacterium RIFOXYA2_FULL_49_16]OGJ95487.1 MAG: hypothetical protein A2350_11905 [Candidatus Raymondbacteria bacterium RifOxyB12_full_50_8]OGK05654.1 MAG: hypothetical protein A2519_06115 [Candidatus Raymondbacteria bacterium RIFOXYD12_FULL_49_13]OGP43812.1 MAG: hypothetical protein A2324_19970 [Candidatus Raymondbacteria 
MSSTRQSATLTVDSRNRICLTKILGSEKISSVVAHMENERIILDPMVEIPAREAWIYKNKKALASLQKGLSLKTSVSRGSFAKYAEE